MFSARYDRRVKANYAGGVSDVEPITVGASTSLLLTADYGIRPSLKIVAAHQARIREFVLTVARYEVTIAGVNPFISSVLAPQESKVRENLNGMLENDHFSTPLLQSWHLYPVDPSDDMLSISSSLTVNPWQEIITPMLGTGGIASAGALAVKNANSILNFAVRLSTLREERLARISSLRHDAVTMQCDTVVKVLGELDNEGNQVFKRLAAGALLKATLDLHNASWDQFVRFESREVSVEEAEERRRALLHLVSSSESDES